MASTKTEIAELLKAPPPSPPVESIISEGFNEELGNADNTTLLPLDVGTLEDICRLNLPGVPVKRRSIIERFCTEPLAFQQLIQFLCGANFRPFAVHITQCTNHVDAVKAMKQAVYSMTYTHGAHGLEAVKDKKLGNYAVKSKDGTMIIWTRWTTVVQVHSHAFPGRRFHGKPSVDIQALAAALDSAMKAHKGTIAKVPKAGLNEYFEVPTFDYVHQTKIIGATFDDGIHKIREYRFIQHEMAFVVEDDVTSKYGNSDDIGGRFCSDLKVTFLKKEVPADVEFMMAHKSSLWPVRDVFALDDLGR